MTVKKGRKKKKKMDAAVAELMAGPKKGEVLPALTAMCYPTILISLSSGGSGMGEEQPDHFHG